MPGPWITAAQLTASVADALGVQVSDLAQRWTGVISLAVQSATNQITTQLNGKGFSLPQIDMWDRRVEFSYDLGLYWCGRRGGFITNYVEQWVVAFDRRQELEDMRSITINGVTVFPAALTPSGSGLAVAGGDLSGSVPRRDWGCLEL